MRSISHLITEAQSFLESVEMATTEEVFQHLKSVFGTDVDGFFMRRPYFVEVPYTHCGDGEKKRLWKVGEHYVSWREVYSNRNP